MRYRHRVDSKRAPSGVVLPKDAWRGREFVEADGTVCVVVASGKMPSAEWPLGSVSPNGKGYTAKLNLRKG